VAALAIRVATTTPTWLIATYPIIHRPSPPASRSPVSRRFQRGRSGTPTRRSSGSSTRAWTAMPSVVPAPRSQIWVSVIVAGVSSPGALTAMNSPPVAMTTTLLSTGAQAGGPNTPRELRIAVASAPRP
jgi:hypothetical protein